MKLLVCLLVSQSLLPGLPARLASNLRPSRRISILRKCRHECECCHRGAGNCGNCLFQHFNSYLVIYWWLSSRNHNFSFVSPRFVSCQFFIWLDFVPGLSVSVSHFKDGRVDGLNGKLVVIFVWFVLEKMRSQQPWYWDIFITKIFRLELTY